MKNRIFTAITTLGLAASATAATVSINIGSSVNQANDISGSELVGLSSIVEGADSWINATADYYGNNSGANAGNGDNTAGMIVGGITIKWDGNFYGTSANGSSDSNHTMMLGYIAMNNAGGTYVTIEGLGTDFTDNGYDVYVYLASDTTRTHALRGSDGTTTLQVTGASTTPSQYRTDVTDGGDYTTNPTYIKLSGFTGTDFTITRGNTGGVPQIAGIQIVSVVPEPSSAALLGLGGLTLILRRRK